MNCIDYFDRGWRMDPDAPCLVHAESGEIHSYGRVRETTLRIANTLRRKGYAEGGKSAVLSYNDPLGYTIVLGIMRSGSTWLPLNPRNGVADNAQIMELLDCDLLFIQEAFAGSLPEIRRLAPRIREIVCIDAVLPGAVSLGQWLENASSDEVELPADPDRLFNIQPTGGTTGFPKGVMISNRALENVVASFMSCAPCEQRPVFLAAAPLTHAAGMVMQHLLAQGGSAVVFPKVDREALLDAIPRHRATHLFLPPTVIYELLPLAKAQPRDFSSLRYFFYGASPMAPERLEEAIGIFGPVMAQIYGQTEAGVPNTFLSPKDHLIDGKVAPPSRLASCGRASPFSRVAIMSEDGSLLPTREVGEIVVRGNGVMSGYYKNPEATEEVSRHGWHHTGDLGYQDEQGFFYIVDRMKDMVISGGFNIFSAEVERALMSHPEVLECAVIGVPDPKWGEAVKAVVVCRPGTPVKEDDLLAHCKAVVGSMKSPKSVDFVEELPRSPVGKVLKRELRQRYWDGRDRLVS